MPVWSRGRLGWAMFRGPRHRTMRRLSYRATGSAPTTGTANGCRERACGSRVEQPTARAVRNSSHSFTNLADTRPAMVPRGPLTGSSRNHWFTMLARRGRPGPSLPPQVVVDQCRHPLRNPRPTLQSTTPNPGTRKRRDHARRPRHTTPANPTTTASLQGRPCGVSPLCHSEGWQAARKSALRAATRSAAR